jgi:pimeloyl-ACP methyl ester carboxylesterase
MFSTVLLLYLSIDVNAANGPNLVMEEFIVPAAEPGINLYVRNKHPGGMNTFPAEKILLFVHGSTYPSEAGFDMKLNGLSWMDYIARHGYDVYFVDLRGYGKSTRLPRWTSRQQTTSRSYAPRPQSRMSARLWTSS